MAETLGISGESVIPVFPCHDCSVNTCPLEGDREYYEITDELWHEAGGPGIGQSDNGTDGFFLCIGCLEDRLKRKLQPGDFKRFPANMPSPWHSDRLNDRLTSGTWTVWHKETAQKKNVQQFFPNALFDIVIERFRPSWTYRDHAGATCIGFGNKSPG